MCITLVFTAVVILSVCLSVTLVLLYVSIVQYIKKSKYQNVLCISFLGQTSQSRLQGFAPNEGAK